MESIGVGMIVKNEEKDLPRCLESIKDIASVLCIVDTGSTDGTERIAREFAARTGIKLIFETYLAASEQDAKGNWSLVSFSKARNRFVKLLDNEVDRLLWMDADDDLSRSFKISELPEGDSHKFQIHNGGDRFDHLRLWKTKKGFHFAGACHEYPVVPNGCSMTHSGIHIVHHHEAQAGQEGAISRNLRILQHEFAHGARDSRTLFYLANSLRDAQRFDEAVKFYDMYLARNDTIVDERVCAWWYKARCQRFLKLFDKSVKTALKGLSEDPRVAELWMEACYSSFSLGSTLTPIFAGAAATSKLFPTQIFREINKYQDQPWRMLSFWYEIQGDIKMALSAASKVLEFVSNDPAWQKRIEHLKELQNEVHVCRPGAAGDVLCCLTACQELKRRQPQKKIIFYTSQQFACLAEACPAIAEVRALSAIPKNVIQFVGYPLKEGYPNVPMKEHLVRLFGRELGIEIDEMPELLLNLPPNPMEGLRYLTIQTKAGWSPYKEWPQDRWQEVIDDILEDETLCIVQLGGPDDPILEGIENACGKRSFLESIAILKGARCHLGIDSFLNHALNVYPKTPAMVLWGSTQPEGSGYPHVCNVSAKLECSPCYREYPGMSAHPKPACPFDLENAWDNKHHQCMLNISVSDVVEDVKRLLKEEKK